MTINVPIGDTPEYEAALYQSLRNRGIPAYMLEPVVEYVMRGRPVGNFLAALFSNDLMEAFGRADDHNCLVMQAYVKLLYNDCPSGCYRSPEAHADWLCAGGLRGVMNAEKA